MKLSLSAACAIVAALQARVQHCLFESRKARNASSRAAAVTAGETVRRIDKLVAQGCAERWERTVIEVVKDLHDVGPEFAYVLRQFPAANDERFAPNGAE